MKKIFSVLVVLSLAFILVAGCGLQTQPSKEVSDDTEPVVKTKPTVTETEDEPAVENEVVVEEVPAKVPSKQIQGLLAKHSGRVMSMRYMYQDALNKPSEWETWISGDQMHVELRDLDNVQGDVYIDNIYLDLSTKKAVAYCEASVYRCADPNNPIEVNFNKYYRKTPMDWIESVTYAEKESEETIQQRTVWKIFYNEDGKDVTMWVDDYYGVPLKVTVQDGSAKNDYIFEDIGFEAVDESDLRHNLITT